MRRESSSSSRRSARLTMLRRLTYMPLGPLTAALGSGKRHSTTSRKHGSKLLRAGRRSCVLTSKRICKRWDRRAAHTSAFPLPTCLRPSSQLFKVNTADQAGNAPSPCWNRPPENRTIGPPPRPILGWEFSRCYLGPENCNNSARRRPDYEKKFKLKKSLDIIMGFGSTSRGVFAERMTLVGVGLAGL